MSAPESSSSGKAALAAATACLFFGASVVATRFAVAQTTPVLLAFLRYAIGTACMLAVLRGAAFPPMPARDRRQVVLLGVLFFGVFPWSFSASLTHLPSTHVALIVATNPLVTLAFARLRGLERITPAALGGQLLAFGGLALALPPLPTAGLPGLPPGAWLGYAEAGITVLCGALYNVWSRPLLLRHGAPAITAQCMAAGTLALAPLALAPLALAGGVTASLQLLTPGGWAAVLFLGTFGGALAFGLWTWALGRSTPSRVAVFLALNPVTAIALGATLLGEPIGWRLLVGLGAVLAGIQLATRPRAT